jgi:micrococcal nuclease
MRESRLHGAARTVAVLAVVVVASACGAIAAVSTPDIESSPTLVAPIQHAIPTSESTATPREARPTPDALFRPTGQTTKATVVRVVDGDTIVVNVDGTQYKVRYIGMDTPETVDPSRPVQWMGPEASAANKALVLGRMIVLEKDVSETDRFGRLLRYVWLTDGAEWTLVNLALVQQGFASVSTYPPDVKYVDVYLAAELGARTHLVGLWGAAPTVEATGAPTENPVPEGSNCHPAYDPCLPMVADLDCPEIRVMGKAPVKVEGPDDYRLDADGDGVGCE